MKYFIKNENPYEFDLDEKGMLALTKKNVAFINGIIKNDSSYRRAMDPTIQESSFYFIKEHGISCEYDIVLEQIKRIDKENSTHLASSGVKPGSNQGYEYTAKKICGIERFKERISEGDPDLVNEISTAIPNRNTFSFASKFCTYVSRYAFEDERQDNYSIYDQVLGDVIPYYAWIFLGKKYKKIKNSSIRLTFVSNPDYRGYRDLIDEIRKKSFEEIGYQISREEFDHLLWYYYKSDQSRIRKGLELVGKIDI